jgi:hypothetical protein
VLPSTRSPTPGNGITATVAVEDATVRRSPILNNTFLAAGPAGLPIDYTAAGNFMAYGGSAVPNLVAALQVDQAWGSAKLAGVITNVRPSALLAAPGILATVPSTKYGFAINGALKINLPMIAAGDQFVVTGTYAEGATNYIGNNYFSTATSAQAAGGVSSWNFGDAGFNNATGTLKLTKAWSVAAGFQHFWAPTLSSTLFGSYMSIDVPFQNAINPRDGNRDGKAWQVGLNTIWQPVRGLNIGGEISYLNFDPSGRVNDVNKNNNFANVNQTNLFTKGQQGVVVGRFRITRDF